jgi:hypothetical protein
MGGKTMKKFYYMTSSSTGIKTIFAASFWAVWASQKSWYGSGTTFVIWDENDETRIFHGTK